MEFPRTFEFSFEKYTYYFEIIAALTVVVIPEGLPAVITTFLAMEKACYDKSGHFVTNEMPTEAALKVLAEKMELPAVLSCNISPKYDGVLSCSNVWNKVEQRSATFEFDRDMKTMGFIEDSRLEILH